MKCPRCQNEMGEEQRICEKCGWERHHFPGGVNTLDEKKDPVLPQQKSPFMQTQMPAQTQVSNSNRDLLDVFIGPNSEKIKKGGFNFAAFFFGGLYCCYRKMYLLAVVFYFVCEILNAFLAVLIPITWLLYLINFIFSFILGFVINKIYVNRAKKKIENIQKENPNLDENQLYAILGSKGGTSVAGIFIFFVIILGITAIFTMFAAKLTKNTIDRAYDTYANVGTDGVISSIRLGIVEKKIDGLETPTNTKFAILDYTSYISGMTVNGGTFMLTDDDKIEVFDLDLETLGTSYICNGLEDNIRCKKKK